MGSYLWALVRRVLFLFPRASRHRLLRRLIRLNWEIPENLQIKVAETKEELDQAFSILHDAYVKEGYALPDPSGRRNTPYHTSPHTKVVVAKWNGEVVGTVSIIQQNSLGLPLESAFDLSHLRKNGEKICEISSLAINSTFQEGKRRILFSLLKFIWVYNKNYLGNDKWVIAVDPNLADFYEAVLLFRRVPGQGVKNYEFANGVSAVTLYLNVGSSVEKYSQVYHNAPLEQNLYWWFVTGPKEKGLILKECLFPAEKIPDEFKEALASSLAYNYQTLTGTRCYRHPLVKKPLKESLKVFQSPKGLYPSPR